MTKRFTAEERVKIIQAFEADGSCPEGYYIIKNKNDVYNIRRKKEKKGAAPKDADQEVQKALDTPDITEEEDSATEKPKKAPKPKSL